MRLKTQFIITMLLFGIIIVVVAASTIITVRQVEKVGRQERIASHVAQGASELSYLANDYLIYRESQQLKRWQSRFAAFSAEVATLRVDRAEQQALVANIQANKNRFKEVFDSVSSALGSPSRNLRSAFDPAFFQVSWSRMAVQSQGLAADASRLSQLLDQQMDELRNKRTVLVYAMVSLFGLFLLVSYLLTNRRILKSIVTLRAGTTVIGSGNLDFVFEEKRDDEIGELSQAFNRMTADLKKVTASKTDLEREMAERKQAEEELRQSREWLKITLRSIGDAVIAADASGRITFLNPVAVTLSGWPIKEALGQPVQNVFRIVDEQSGRPAENIVESVLREGFIVNLANHAALIARDGREIPIEDSAAPIRDGAGNIIGVVLVFHDVTEKRRTQEALKKSEEHYRSLFDNMLNGYAYCRMLFEGGKPRDFIYLNVNRAFETLTGLRDVIGKKVSEVIPGLRESDPEIFEIYGRVATTGVPARFETYVEALGMWFSISVYSPRKEHFVAIFEVITEQKEAERALKESEERFRQMANSIPQLAWIAKGDGYIFWYNQRWYDYTGTTPDQMLGWGWQIVHDPEILPDVLKQWKDSIATGKPFDGVFPLRGADGRFRQFLTRVLPMKDTEGRIIQWFGTNTDITDRKQMEEALQKSHDELEVRVQERTAELYERNKELTIEIVERLKMWQALQESKEQLRILASQILSAQENERKRIALEVHDVLGSSLSAIKFKAEEAMLHLPKDGPSDISRPLEALIPLIQDTIEEARRIQSDLRPPLLDDLGIVPTLSWFCRRFETIYSGTKVEQAVAIPEEEVPDHLKIVLFRITQEAMNNIGKHAQADSVYLGLRKGDGAIELLIKDNGNGFDPESLSSREISKKGMGLSSMRERVQFSGGSFSIESVQGKGTVIRVLWPA
jgi:PAS domain S-box-containing protein